MDAVAAPRFIPPIPPRPITALPLPEFLRAVRTNAIGMWPEAAYEQDHLVGGLAGRRSILLNAPDAIHHVLVGNPGNFRRTPATVRILRPITGKGLLLSEGEDWKLQRRTIAPALAPRVMPMLASHIARSAEATLDALPTGEPVNLLGAMQALALDIAGRSMFSMDMAEHREMLRRLMYEYGEGYSKPHMMDMLLPPSIPTLRDIGRWRFKKRWMAYIDSLIATRLASPPPDQPRDLLDLLRAARDPETGAGFSAEQLRDQVATLILAGHETTAVTLFWALITLASLPDEQDRIAAEAAPLDLSPAAAHGAMGQLVRTKAVVNETLRLFPAAFTLARQVIARDNAAGIPLPKNALLLIAPWVLQRHRKLWVDPDAFDPDRFMPDAPPPPRFAFMPFGAGPRVCVGAQFAMEEAVLVLAALLRRFRVTRVDDRPVLPVGIVTTQPDHAAPVLLSRRAP
ncbi:MAG: cytochrome P450 [Proteobacteria bacterium]|nr:cytochrome P450 [Pseudomonadota bacterium]